MPVEQRVLVTIKEEEKDKHPDLAHTFRKMPTAIAVM
jgi:hypothetical protein